MAKSHYQKDDDKKVKSPYELWIDTSTAPMTSSKSQEKLSKTTKHKDHMKKTMEQIISYSPEFKLNKFNNYDNTVQNVSR